MRATTAPPGGPVGHGDPVPPPARNRRLMFVGLLVVCALGFLLFQGLSHATVYFKTADEAVAERASLGTRRFRLEGMVVAGTVADRGDQVDFSVVGEEGAVVPVVHDGNVPELFQPGIPVVMEGRWDGNRYRSDRILVRHTSQYRADNPDRVVEYRKSPAAP
ncbi:MAG: cytochrome c maturation protein CcmE [Acidimicrobiales bacterium]